MERQADTHLNLEELDALLRSGPPFSRAGDNDLPEARQHLESCNICQSELQAHTEEDGRLARLQLKPSAARGPNCPRDSDWLMIASGITRGSEAEALVQHSATCDHCGPLLREALADFAEEVSSEEEEVVAGLRSSSPEWQERMAVDLAKSRLTRRIFVWVREHLPALPRIPLWTYPAGAAALCGAALLFYVQQPSVDRLLAAAYTDQRTFELRIPDAAYAPVRMVRGSSGRSRLDRPSALLEGEARIARELMKDPRSPRWLESRGRAELLERDYDSAIASFRKALEFQPNSYSAITDLASAFFERAEADNSQADYSLAIESLSRALNMKPDDPVALFNRAVVYERVHLYGRAIEDWQHYLRVDRTSAWIREANQRLADVERASNLSK